jgi:SnoaL-like domain
MTTATNTDAGVALIDALRRADLDDARALLADDIHLSGLMPSQSVEADGRDDALAVFEHGLVNPIIERVDVVATGNVSDRRSIAYRILWSTDEAGPHVCEQHAFYDVNGDGKIAWFHFLCSGNHPRR